MLEARETSDGRLADVFVCDVCNEIITDASEAMVIMPYTNPPGEGRRRVLHAHTHDCSDTLKHREQNQDGICPFMPMRYHISNLIQNAGLTPQSLTETNDFFRESRELGMM